MASANFLEEALKSDVDESAVNAIVGTLENQLDVNTNQPPAAGVQQVDGGKRTETTAVLSNGGTATGASSNRSSSASPPTAAAAVSKKHVVVGGGGSGLITNGEIVSNNSANHGGSAIINNNTITTNNNNLGKTFVVNASVHSSITSSTTTTGTVIGGGSGGVKTVVGGSANNHNSVGSVSVSLSNSNNNNSGGAQQQQHQQQQQQQQHQLQRNAHPATVVATGGTTGGGGGGTVNIISQQIVVPARSGSGTTVVGGQQHHQHPPPPPPFNVPPQQPTNVSSSGNIVLSSNAHHHHIVTSSNMPKNEPVKLVYPAGGPQAVLNMNNNRVTLTPSSLPNGGTLTMSQQPQLIQTSVGGAKTLTGATIQQHQQQQQATVVNQAGQQQQQQPGQQPGQQTIIIKNASGGNTVMNAGAPGIVTVSKPMNNQATPNIVGLPGGVQIVNVRPGAQPTQAQQKTVAAVSPRVVIGSQPIVSTRPPNASAITLSALQGQPGSTLLLKNEQGQFQLLRIGPAPAGTQITPAGLTGSSANQTIRLQTVPAVSRFTGPPLALRKTIVTSAQQVKQKQNTHSSGSGAIIVSSQSITTTPASYISTQPTPVASVAPVPALAAQQNITITHSPSQVGGQPTVLAAQQQQQQTTTVVATPHSVGQQQSQQQQQQTVVVTTTPGTTPAQQRNSLDNTKEKCSKFLTNLIELSKREPAKVEQNVRTLIQELVDANVDPAEFCERLERLLNASPQPCLIGFLKKSLPLLRQSLVTKEITIEGINPPSTAVAFGTTALSQIPAQIRPVAPTIVSQNSMVGQTQIRMLTSQSGVTTVPRIGQTTIRPAAPVRIQTPLQQQQPGGTTTTIVGPRSITAQQIRPNATTIGHTTIVQTAGGQQLPQTISTTPPALLPIRAPSGTSITRTGATLQIRTTTPVSRTVTSVGGTTVTTGGLGKQLLQSQVNQIRGQTPVASVAAVAAAAAAAASGTTATQVKQVTAITGGGNVVVSLNQVPPPMQPVSGNASIIGGTAVSLVPTMPALTLTSSAVSAVGLSAAGIVSSSSASSSSASSSSSAATTVGPPGGISATVVVNSVPSATPAVASAATPPTGTTSIGTAASGVGGASSSSSSSAATVTTVSTNKTVTAKSQNLSGASKKKAGAASAASGPDAESAASKRAGASAQSQFYHHHASMYGDDDINDVAAMGGVNLAEETQRILGSTEFVGTQIRSCKDEVFLHLPALQSRIRAIIARHGLEEPSNEVAVLISHACQERLKNVVEKLAIIAEHRIDIIKVDPRYEVTKDVRGQIKFLEELDKAEQKRHEEQEREMLMRAAKSRSKTEDPEQAKLKAKAKEMQRAEMEELRQRDANLTALQAIGPRKKPKLEEGASASTTPGVSGIGTLSGKAPTPLRPRIKRVNLRDMLFYLEQERETGKSQMLYKAYLK
ncbi:transcription initiation factor TFIID subunit 4-like isoform X1 [Anopheles arabiensis]|uniref:transcription initiation factor TFIID subunit 4-like isoform X1 n=1 Tax=Anopheles arabiensis TaxID=7173 RepID=UPI001AADA69A|nr:transcription initiation factor TFIID subunit 4-like isoform X1 [Anopheles arabiensis]XP_040158440.1 transcription initiation factor TFIID subunit 4-like isoform X1 [Anopheles arabiensis]